MPDFAALIRRLCAAMNHMVLQDRWGDAQRLNQRWLGWHERQLDIAEREADYQYNRLTR